MTSGRQGAATQGYQWISPAAKCPRDFDDEGAKLVSVGSSLQNLWLLHSEVSASWTSPFRHLEDCNRVSDFHLEGQRPLFEPGATSSRKQPRLWWSCKYPTRLAFLRGGAR